MFKNRLNNKKQIEAFKALEDKLHIGLEPKANKAMLGGGLCVLGGAISAFTLPAYISGAFLIGGMCVLYKAVKDSGKVIDTNQYAICFKYHRFEMRDQANSFITLDIAREFLKERGIHLTYDEVDLYLTSVILHNYAYLNGEEKKSENKRKIHKLRQEYLGKSSVEKSA